MNLSGESDPGGYKWIVLNISGVNISGDNNPVGQFVEDLSGDEWGDNGTNKTSMKSFRAIGGGYGEANADRPNKALLSFDLSVWSLFLLIHRY